MYSEERAVFEVNDDGGASFTKNLKNYVDANKVPIVYLNASRKRVRRNFNVITTRFAEIDKIKSPSIFILDNADFIGCEYFLKLIKAVNATRSKLVLISNDQTTRTPQEDDALPLLRSFGLKKITVKNQITNTLPQATTQTSARTQSNQTIPIPQRTQSQRQPLPQVAQPGKPKTPIQSKAPQPQIYAQSQPSATKVAIPKSGFCPTQPDAPSKQQQSHTPIHTQPQRSQLPAARERQIVNRSAAMNKNSLPAQNNTHPTRPISSSPSIYNREQPRQAASATPASRTSQPKPPLHTRPQYARPTLNPQSQITPPLITNYPKPQQNTRPTTNSAPTKSIPSNTPTIPPDPKKEPPRQLTSWDIDL